jgi:hypothetical protein
MATASFDDRLEPLGVLVGAFLVLFGLGTLVGQPWATKTSMLVFLVQLVGVGLLMAIGVGLVWLVRSD